MNAPPAVGVGFAWRALRNFTSPSGDNDAPNPFGLQKNIGRTVLS